MAEWQTIQSSFINGEVSPRYSASVNSEFVQNAAAEITNGMVLLQGNVTKRLGTNFSDVVPQSTGQVSDPARIWPMFAPSNEEILAVFSQEFVSLIFDLSAGVGDTVPIPGQIQLVFNPSFIQGATGWDFDGRYVSGNISFTSEYSPPNVLNDNLNIAGAGASWGSDASIGTFEVGFSQTLNIPDPATELTYVIRARSFWIAQSTLRIRCGTTPGGSELFQRDIVVPQSEVTEFTEVVTGFPATSGTVYLSVDNRVTTNNDTFGADSIFVSKVLLYANGQIAGTPVDTNTPYTADQLEDLHFIQSPFNNQELFIFHPDVQPHWLYFNGANWVVEPVNFTNQPLEWAGSNWPSICTSYQGRLIVSGARDHPETVWCSRSSDWTDFVELGTITPDSPFDFTPTERGVNTWVHGHKALLFGNTRDEYRVDAQSGIIQASDVAVTQQTGYGGNRNPQRLRMGHAVAIPTNGGQTLKLIQFSREAGGYVAPDLMVQAEHLGKRGIRRMFYTRDPHETLWAVMQDGTLCTMSFNSEGNTRAWSTWNTAGTFIDGAALVDPNGGTVVALLVQRSVNGALQTQIEYLNNLRDIKNWRYLDAAVRRTITSQIVFNVPHLEGHVAHVFLDGSYAGTRLVSSAEVDLTGFDWQNASIVDIGIGYDFRVRTLPQGTISADVGLAAKKRFSKVGIRGVFSNVPVIQGQRYPERPSQTPMNTTQPQNSIIDTFVCDLGTDTTAEVTVDEPLPLRLTIAGIYGKISGNEL